LKTLLTTLLFAVAFFNFNQASAQNNQVKEWTVLVYLNADNDLYRFGFLNMAQMEAIGSTAGMNVVVQFDPEPAGQPTTRYFVTKSPNPVNGKITSQVLEQLPETDMGNPKTLSDFLVWGVQKYPAKKYAVIVWNHGNGWQGVSYDDNPRSHLTMPELRGGFETMNMAIAQQRGARNRGPQIDLVNFDACIMSALEVGYELKDVAKFMVGSQFNEPGEGENYTLFLAPMAAKPAITPRELAEVMVYQYSLNYKGRSGINYAAVDLSRINNFVAGFNQTVGVTSASPNKAKIKNAYGSGSFDLVTGLNNARAAAGTDANATNALDQMIAAYGYPKEGIERAVPNMRESFASAGLTVSRFKPSQVNFKTSVNGQWQQAPMVLGANGQYEYKFQRRPAQYYVVSAGGTRGREVAVRDALTTVLRDDANPIVFHNQFPETSPLIADSYTLQTKGAHGMTLFSLAGMMSARNPSTARFGTDMLSQYKELLFARNGAPNWTAFFGL
tara:strand:+ start:15079 stop:16578 length:1500 start_codon:yes stop_codon:yes gene_type:complete